MSNVAQTAKKIVASMTPAERDLALQQLSISAYWHNGRAIDGRDDLGAAIEVAIKAARASEVQS